MLPRQLRHRWLRVPPRERTEPKPECEVRENSDRGLDSSAFGAVPDLAVGGLCAGPEIAPELRGGLCPVTATEGRARRTRMKQSPTGGSCENT